MPGKIINAANGAFLGWSLTPVIFLFEKYIYNDWMFAGFLAVLFTADTFVGIYKHWRNHTLNADGFRKMFDKLVVVTFWMILSHVIMNFDGDGGQVFKDYFGLFCKTSIIAFLALSIAQNLSDITGGKFPPAYIMNRLKLIDRGEVHVVKKETKVVKTETEIKK